jgi:hypothetical protein
VVRPGRYIARDWRARIELGRRFGSGSEIGSVATVTTARVDDFGEGSFDKGISVRFPFDLFATPAPSRGTATIPALISDGGQRLAVDHRLYEVTREGRRDAWLRGISGLAAGR